MGQNTPVSSKANFVISLLVAAAAVGYFVFGSASPSPESHRAPADRASTAPRPSAESKPSSVTPVESKQGLAQPNAIPTSVAAPSGPDAARPLMHPIPYEVTQPQATLSPEAANALVEELKMQVQTAPNELPEDLKAQLKAAPPELPEDLRKQLNAPPPEIPEDIKAQMAIPPRRVSIDEVNDPNFIQKQDETKTP